MEAPRRPGQDREQLMALEGSQTGEPGDIRAPGRLSEERGQPGCRRVERIRTQRQVLAVPGEDLLRLDAAFHGHTLRELDYVELRAPHSGPPPVEEGQPSPREPPVVGSRIQLDQPTLTPL